MLDTYTKLTAINFILITSLLYFNKHVLNDSLERSPAALAIWWWAILTVANVPVYLCYFIWDM